jgi:signal transduction histidine kinase
MKEKFLRLKNFFGPYVYQPWFIYVTILVLNLSNLRTYTYEYEPGIQRINFVLTGVIIYAIMGLPLYIALKLSRKLWGTREKNFKIYLFELFLGSLITIIAQMGGEQFLLPLVNTVDFLQSGVFVGDLIARFLFALIFVAITHNRLRTLSEKLESTSKLNDQLNERYAKLIESDEEIRLHASQLLHDRIQAKLMLAGAKLTRITEVLSAEGKLGVLPVIKELESIRAIDVRKVSQLLSPNLAGEGLMGSCETLCKEFEGSVDFSIDIIPAVEDLDEEMILGVYRIIEQGVINSIKHGPATEISIEVSISSANMLIVEVKDNGPGGDQKNSGTGTVIIDAWLSILGGRKEIESMPGSGFILRVYLPQNKLVSRLIR